MENRILVRKQGKVIQLDERQVQALGQTLDSLLVGRAELVDVEALEQISALLEKAQPTSFDVPA